MDCSAMVFVVRLIRAAKGTHRLECITKKGQSNLAKPIVRNARGRKLRKEGRSIKTLL
jgi:hypothetical protein